jgi:hypothetical protein
MVTSIAPVRDCPHPVRLDRFAVLDGLGALIDNRARQL